MVAPFAPVPGLTDVIQDGAPEIVQDVQLVVMVNEVLPLPAPTLIGDGEILMVGVAPLCVMVTVCVSPQPLMVNVAVRD